MDHNCYRVIIVLLIVFNCDAKISYDKWKLYRITGLTQISKNVVDNFQTDQRYRIIRAKNNELEVAASPEVSETGFQNWLNVNSLTSKLLASNVGALLKKRQKKSRKKRGRTSCPDRYLSWEEMEDHFHLLEKTYPNAIKKEILGKSYEGRNIYMFTLSGSSDVMECPLDKQSTANGKSNSRDLRNELNLFHYLPYADLSSTGKGYQYGHRIRPRRQAENIKRISNNTHNFFMLNLQPFLRSIARPPQSQVIHKQQSKLTEKPVIFIDGGTHSREWISPAAVLCLIEHIAQNPLMTKKVQWQIIPMINPDGYIYSWEQDRFWRKTRSNTTMGKCNGVDINRNFGHRWGMVDTSNFPCAENFGGSKEFSEIETQILREALNAVKGKIKAYVSIHNWGQDILHPYSYSYNELPRTYEYLKRVSDGMSAAIFEEQRIKYRSGKSAVLLYPASGTAIDWVYDTLDQPLTYLIELRDQMGQLGFILPEKYIEPTSIDLISGSSYLASTIAQNYTKCS